MFALLNPKERQTWLKECAARSNMSEVIVEKDFWVCWMLGVLFLETTIAPHVVFKGGTSLSKVYGAIDRFSEDIDISLSPEFLGCKESYLSEPMSKSQREKRKMHLADCCIKTTEKTLMPVLEKSIIELLGSAPSGTHWLKFEVEAASHSPVIWFNYPQASPSDLPYIPKAVKLELGSLTDQRPVGTHQITPMVATLAPKEFDDFRYEVVALDIERTFWEKATILHAEYHRSLDKPLRDRFARHYSDFASLWNHEGGIRAKTSEDMLLRVAQHKKLFFSAPDADYDSARFGTIRLSPQPSRVTALREDYRKMRTMFFSEPKPFDEVLKIIEAAEFEINGMAATKPAGSEKGA
jgi:hypothetical protein